MARPLRIQYPGAVYHVMNRGNAREPIFRNANSYELFLRCLNDVTKMWELKIHAFSLMPNHYHLLVETPLGNLSRAMRHLNHVYTQRFNRLEKRDGHLFRGRYKAILVEEDAYLVELMRYIHLNPVKDGLVERSEKHAWTSHRHYLKEGGCEFLTTARLLRYFGTSKNRARKKIHEFVLAGVPAKLDNRLSKGGWPSVLSSENFEEWVKWNFVKNLDDKQLRYVPAHHEKVSEKALKRILCHRLETTWSAIENPVGRQQQRNRAIAIWFYRWQLKWGYGQLSEKFHVVPSRITRIVNEKNLVEPELTELVTACLKSEK